MSKQYDGQFTEAELKKVAELLAAQQAEPGRQRQEDGMEEIDLLELARTLWKKAWAILLAAVIYFLIKKFPKVHPAAFIGLSAVAGVAFRFAGV